MYNQAQGKVHVIYIELPSRSASTEVHQGLVQQLARRNGTPDVFTQDVFTQDVFTQDVALRPERRLRALPPRVVGRAVRLAVLASVVVTVPADRARADFQCHIIEGLTQGAVKE